MWWLIHQVPYILHPRAVVPEESNNNFNEINFNTIVFIINDMQRLPQGLPDTTGS